MVPMRVDQWLWTARFFKSRTQATNACRSGRVRVNDKVAKAATEVKPGDEVTWRERLRSRRVVVVALLPRRVAAPLAAEAYTDLSPALPTRAEQAATGVREPGTGRPTKQERRQTDAWLGFRR
jgi:ribosome-associated heat shock protein Hsp15